MSNGPHCLSDDKSVYKVRNQFTLDSYADTIINSFDKDFSTKRKIKRKNIIYVNTF